MRQPGSPRLSSANLMYAGLLVASVFFLYWKALKYPFIQDDWCVMYSIAHKGGLGFLREIIPGGFQPGFHRPLPQLVILGLYQLFGLDAFGYRIVLLLLHCCNAGLVMHISSQLSSARLLSWAAGTLYALALSIHLDTLLWIVGIYDILGASFFFLSVTLFVKKKKGLSLITYTLGLLTKEAVVILPLILFCYVLAVNHDKNEQFSLVKKLKASVAQVIPFVIVLCMFLVLRLSIVQSLNFADGTLDPYEFKPVGTHIVSNLISYSRWSFESFVPFFGSSGYGGLLVLVFIVCIIWFRKTSCMGVPKMLFLLAWSIIGLLPVLFLTHHAFRYYLTYSLPALMLLSLDGLRSLIIQIRRNDSLFLGAVTILVLFNMSYAYISFAETDQRGFDIPTIQGSNNLSRKGALITMVHDYLKEKHPVLAKGTVLIFDWLPIASFCSSSGPRIWYGDSTVEAYEIQNIELDSTGVLSNKTAGYLDPGRLIVLAFHGDNIREVELPWPARLKTIPEK